MKNLNQDIQAVFSAQHQTPHGEGIQIAMQSRPQAGFGVYTPITSASLESSGRPLAPSTQAVVYLMG